MKRLTFFLCVCLCSIVVHAKVIQGTCGTDLSWSYDTETFALTITGTGAMTNYSSSSSVPWATVNANILSVTLSEEQTTIGNYAFYGCSSLTSITIPNSITGIGTYAFRGCSAITSLSIGNSVTSIGNYAFYNCSALTSLTIPNSVTSIGKDAFYGCSSITSLTIPNSVTSIGNYAFSGCEALTSLTIGNSVTSIGYEAFKCSKLDTVVWNAKNCKDLNSSSGWAIFYSNHPTTIIFGDDVERIPAYLYTGASNVHIGKRVKSIGAKAFYYSTERIVIPDSVTTIGDQAFYQCPLVVMRSKTPPTIASQTFKSDVMAYVPCSAKRTYLSANFWNFLGIYGIPTHNLSVNSSAGGTATILSCDCDTWGIEATADPLYHFVQWSDGNTENPRSIDVGEDLTLEATFSLNNPPQPLYDFSNVSDNGDWQMINGTQTNQWIIGDATGNGDSHALYISNDGSSYGYDNTNSSTVWAYLNAPISDNVNISFDWKGYGYGSYDYMYAYLIPLGSSISAGSTSVPSGAIKLGNRFNGSDEWSTFSQTCMELNGNYYLAFMWRNSTYSDGSSPIAIDNVKVRTAVSKTYQVSISAGEGGSLANGNVSTTINDCSGEGQAMNNICAQAGFGYRFVDWSDGNTNPCRDLFITQDTNLVARFETSTGTLKPSYDFSNASDNGDWMLLNGTQTNQWIIGDATGNGDSHALYISNDGSSYGYDNTNSSTVWAYLNAPISGNVNISFDWIGYGESSYDYMYAYLIPLGSSSISAGSSSVPSGAIKLGNRFNGSNEWSTFSQTCMELNGNYYLAFMWRNDGSSGSTPIAIDNVKVQAAVSKTYQVNITASAGGYLTNGDIHTTITDCTGAGETLTDICPNANDGYYFAGWSDGNTNECRDITITSDTTIIAVFKPYEDYTVTLRGWQLSGSYSDASAELGYSEFEQQSEITLTLPYNSYVFFYEDISCGEWTGWSDGVTDSSRSIRIISDTVITSSLYNTIQTYNVHLAADAGGYIMRYNDSIQQLDTVLTECNDYLYFEAVALEGYYFAGWSDGYPYTGHPLTATQDTTITAYFNEIRYYTVHIEGQALSGYYMDRQEDGGVGYPNFDRVTSVDARICNGDIIEVTEWGECGNFLGWSDGVEDINRSITITSDTTITALFDAATYHIELRAEDGGSLDGEGTKVYSEDVLDCEGFGVIGYIYAVPDEGYSFTQWSDGSTDAYRKVIITQDTTLVASFEETVFYSVTLRGNNIGGYYVYVTDQWGNTSREYFSGESEVNFLVEKGLLVVVNENNTDCGTWLGWSDGSTNTHRELIITSDTVITSLFDAPTYHVVLNTTEGGMLRDSWDEPIEGIETDLIDCNGYGTSLGSFCAEAQDGYYFTGWSDGVTYQCRGIYDIHSDTTFTAFFAEAKPVQLQVLVESGSQGMGSVSGGGDYRQGDFVTITATPNEGHHFIEWSDGSFEPTRDIYLMSDSTITASFGVGEIGGKCGENLYWRLDGGALTITGTGDMDVSNYPTWRSHRYVITSLSMPEGMTSIAYSAFYGQQLTEVTVPASVKRIEGRAFANNSELVRFVCLGDSIENAYNTVCSGDYQLRYFQGHRDLLGNTLSDYIRLDTVIITGGDYVFSCYTYARYIDNRKAKATYIGSGDSYGIKAVETLFLPEKATSIDDYALSNAHYLGGITIPADVEYIGTSAFEGCRKMDSVVFAGNRVETIGDWAFYDCHKLRRINIPEGVITIGKSAFFGCLYLSELTLPSTLSKIAENGFGACRGLHQMVVNALVPPTIEGNTFEDVDRNTPVWVPLGTLERYQSAPFWSEFFHITEYDSPMGNAEISSDQSPALQKVVRDGQVLIIRGNQVFTVLGEQL
ncbi:MAG: leucine-rich repeat protein [Paludibacteraceae bacterium]